MPSPATPIRRLEASDVAEILRLQQRCYAADYLESRRSFEVKVAASPSCFGAFANGAMLGYALAFPWTTATPVPLSSEWLQLPQQPTCLYIHDVAIDPSARGVGLGTALVDVLYTEAQRLDLAAVELVAVQGAATYWERLGFRALDGDTSGYGTQAVRMQHLLH